MRVMGRMGQVPIATVARKRLPYNTQEGKFITFLNDLMPKHPNIGRLGVAIDCNGITIDGHYPINRGDRGAEQYDRQKGAEPDRQTCREPRTHAPHDAWNEPGETRRRVGFDVPATSEVREGPQPDWRQPIATNFSHPSSASRVLL